MRFFATIVGLALVSTACQHGAKQVTASHLVAGAKEPFIQRPRQITFSGMRAGEGYFSADGSRMIFQSDREPKNPFYQIYVKDLMGGEIRRVSTGEGRTTCAWLHPFENKALFASTHLDKSWRKKAEQELAMRKSGEREKYSWSYDDQYDLFVRDLTTGRLQVLNPALGYDAEGSYSPDGQWIAFASNRHAYSGPLSPEEQRRREEDPAFFMEIYLMRADGTGLKRLTSVAGYDGGPFFSADGQSIVWRRFTPDGKQAEVWTMNVDGSEQRQITQLKAMSWAPYFHPSGDYIIFASNLIGYDNFELFVVDRLGAKAPIRVSFAPGFDGLPVFTPDGQQVSWTHRNQKGESQIMIADWNDGLVREHLGLKPWRPTPGMSHPEIRVGDARAWVEYLASAEMAGRMAGSREEDVYTQRLAAQFSRLGMKFLVGNDYRQKFSYPSGVRLGPGNRLTIDGVSQVGAIEVNADWAPLSFGATGRFAPTEAVFAGYGIVAPATEKQAAYDALQGLNVKDKWVVVLRDLPENIPNEQRFHLNLYSRLQHKALVARQAGARGLIVVSPGKQRVELAFEGGSGESGIPLIEINSRLAATLVATTGQSLTEWKIRLDKGETGGGDLKGVKIGADVAIEQIRSEAHNVLAVLNVPGAIRTVVIGAHGDHLGHGEAGNSLAKPHERGQIHYGADDNASGVAAVMELAEHFAGQMARGDLKSKANLAFAIWSAEELGVLGASHFTSQYKGPPLLAYLNLDMVGRLRDQLMVQGVGSAEEWPVLMERLAVKTDLALSLQEDPYLPTDSLAFYLKGVPSLSFFTGAHLEYHSPRDVPELINYPGVVKVADAVRLVANDLIATGKALTYRKVEGGRSPLSGRGFRLYLGTVPDYSQDGVRGVRIAGTSKASPAEKAGLREGDIIVRLGETKIENIQDYVYCLQSMKANEKTPIRVVRDGQELDLEIVPALKGM